MVVLVLLPTVGKTQPVNAATEQAPLSEADVIRLARSRAPGAAVARATDELAEARTRTAGLFPNPALHWSREAVTTGPVQGQGSEDQFAASIPIDVARTLTTRALVASEGAWLRAEASLSRRDAVLEAVLAYYDVVFAERRVDVLSRGVSNLEEAARVLTRREAAGTASGYESTRLSIASELSRSHLAEARGALESTRARLGALVGMRPETLRVASALELPTAPRKVAATSTVERARESQQLAAKAADRAAWAWLPTLELSGGVLRASNLGADDGYGYVLGVSLGIPLFDRGQAQRRQAHAQRALASARVDALRRTLDAEAQSALATYRTAHQELSRFEAQTSDQVESLLAAAQSGYREGERTIVELLDAQRAQTEVAERRLSLLATAKRAEARLRAATGDLQ